MNVVAMPIPRPTANKTMIIMAKVDKEEEEEEEEDDENEGDEEEDGVGDAFRMVTSAFVEVAEGKVVVGKVTVGMRGMRGMRGSVVNGATSVEAKNGSVEEGNITALSVGRRIAVGIIGSKGSAIVCSLESTKKFST
jgi:hypothetical protein